ncbi:Putative cyclic nucleotide-gated ion channel 18 [Apostasia shenzhenica]|uniref:Cyclic nucleotide-gated ion channel 18 n=1 Tax=Apostasia shenzhenica TaxID=1088818 RepID=A0A2I0A5Y4_9ASPA|nr:Putative cyclic nucleotide-gated ion channel 18 [Apostasia shenzhenica]
MESRFLISCLVALFLDRLYFYLMFIGGPACMRVDLGLGIIVTFFRTVAHMMLKFRTTFVAPSSRVLGRGELVKDPHQIAMRYLKGDFVIDLAAMLPIPQVFEDSGFIENTGSVLFSSFLRFPWFILATSSKACSFEIRGRFKNPTFTSESEIYLLALERKKFAILFLSKIPKVTTISLESFELFKQADENIFELSSFESDKGIAALGISSNAFFIGFLVDCYFVFSDRTLSFHPEVILIAGLLAEEKSVGLYL